MFLYLKNISGWRKTAPLGISQFLEPAKVPARELSLIQKPINTRQTSSSWPVHPMRQYSSALAIQETGVRQLGTISIVPY